MNSEKEKVFKNSEPAERTLFRSKIFVTDEKGNRYMKSAVGVRTVPKLSKMEKKALKRARVLNFKLQEGK